MHWKGFGSGDQKWQKNEFHDPEIGTTDTKNGIHRNPFFHHFEPKKGMGGFVIVI